MASMERSPITVESVSNLQASGKRLLEDMQTGKDRAQQQAEQAKRQVDDPDGPAQESPQVGPGGARRR